MHHDSGQRDGEVSRRRILAGGAVSGAGLILGGCFGQSVTRRFRVIATVDVDGKTIEGSTVMQITYSRVKNSLIGSGGSTSLKGEALILDLPGKGTIYAMPVSIDNNGSLTQIYDYVVFNTLEIPGAVGAVPDWGVEKLRTSDGRFPFRMGGRSKRLPLFVAFIDDQAPKTIYEVDPFNMSGRFSGVTLKSFDIEFTDAPVTSALFKRLPWLAERGPHFNSDPPGKHRPVYEQPLSYKISAQKFFAQGSQ